MPEVASYKFVAAESLDEKLDELCSLEKDQPTHHERLLLAAQIWKEAYLFIKQEQDSALRLSTGAFLFEVDLAEKLQEQIQKYYEIAGKKEIDMATE